MGKNIIVSNRLPVQIKKEGEVWVFSPTSGGLATGMKSFHQDGDSLWVGWPGISSDKLDEVSREQIDTSLDKDSYKAVYLNEEELENFYFGLSNKCLWPLFHYFVEYHQFDTVQWEHYVAVNKKFADVVIANLEDGDKVWIHDYQLLLCPQMIKVVKPEVTIGFFLHIPFPSFEIFRIFPKREALLHGLLGSDLIGFHTFDYERHFISSIKRILRLEVNFNVISYEGREVIVNTFPMGIDFKKFETAAHKNLSSESSDSSELKRQIEAHKTESQGKLILSIDRLDYTKGVVNRLRAFELFLDQNPNYHEKVRLVMLAVPSRARVVQYKKLKRETDEVVGRINGKFATVNWTPIWYYYRSMDFENLIDLYLAADVAMITPVRDGMNLVAKEYLATRIKNDGVLILSELAGAAKELPQAIMVNPFDTNQLAKSIKTAIQMPLNEQYDRNKISRKRIKRYDIEKWASSFMEALNKAGDNSYPHEVQPVIKSVADQMKKDYILAKRKLLLLDYDGTLVGFRDNPLKAVPSQYVIRLLTKLSQKDGTDLVIISGRPPDFLDVHFAHLNITLVAEHGHMSKAPGMSWEEKKGASKGWMQHLLPILETFTDNTPGTFIEQKINSLVWHYRKADPELGNARAVELKTVLTSMLTNELALLDGNKIIELVSANINKGTVALELFNAKSYDFILAAGDDVTDENTFLNLPSTCNTIKIGKKNTAASYYLAHHHKFLDLLESFT